MLSLVLYLVNEGKFIIHTWDFTSNYIKQRILIIIVIKIIITNNKTSIKNRHKATKYKESILAFQNFNNTIIIVIVITSLY